MQETICGLLLMPLFMVCQWQLIPTDCQLMAVCFAWSRHAPQIPKMKSQKGVLGRPGLECQKSVEKSQMSRKRVKKTTNLVFGDFFDTFKKFLTLRAEKPGKSFLGLFWDFGARGVETPVYGDSNRNVSCEGSC